MLHDVEMIGTWKIVKSVPNQNNNTIEREIQRENTRCFSEPS